MPEDSTDHPNAAELIRHAGPNRPVSAESGHASPYPLQRLSGTFDLVDVAREIETADQLLGQTTNARLEELALQIRGLQARAREIMHEARVDAALHRARCSFHRRVGTTYYLYRRDAPSGELYFSLLSPAEWGTPPHEFAGAFRLEPDMRWAPVGDSVKPDLDFDPDAHEADPR